MNTSSFISPDAGERPQPLSGNAMPRCGGIATMMRLPNVGSA
ncbi:MAG TPA: agmatinase, partial [Paraburkholderia sp.]